MHPRVGDIGKEVVPDCAFTHRDTVERGQLLSTDEVHLSVVLAHYVPWAEDVLDHQSPREMAAKLPMLAEGRPISLAKESLPFSVSLRNSFTPPLGSCSVR